MRQGRGDLIAIATVTVAELSIVVVVIFVLILIITAKDNLLALVVWLRTTVEETCHRLVC